MVLNEANTHFFAKQHNDTILTLHYITIMTTFQPAIFAKYVSDDELDTIRFLSKFTLTDILWLRIPALCQTVGNLYFNNLFGILANNELLL